MYNAYTLCEIDKSMLHVTLRVSSLSLAHSCARPPSYSSVHTNIYMYAYIHTQNLGTFTYTHTYIFIYACIHTHTFKQLYKAHQHLHTLTHFTLHF